MRKSINGAVWLFMMFLSVGVTACGSFASYRLPVAAYEAHRTFAPLAACASAQSLTAIEHPTSVNVRFDPETWIQFMIQGEQYNMVIIVGNDVPPEQRAARTSSAKAKGDELWACAMNHGVLLGAVVPVVVMPPPAMPVPPTAMPEPVSPTPPAAISEPISPPPSAPRGVMPPAAPTKAAACRNARELAPRSACASAAGPACTTDSQCPSNNCTRGACQRREPGSPCKEDAQCNSNNCTGGCCHAREVGAHCMTDANCNSNSCTNGICQNREPGSPCKEDSHCNTNNCTAGCCGARTPGGHCSMDAHCNSNRCANGICQ